MSVSAIGSLNSLNGANSTQQFDPTQMINAMSQSFIQKYDTNGDGSLTNQEVSGLSADAFQALTNGSGQLTSADIQSAMQKYMSEMKQAASSSDPTSAMQALQKTPEGQLMQMMRAGHHHHGQQSQAASSGQTASSSQGQPSPIEITINQTIYNNTGQNTTGQSQSSLDVTT